PTRPFPQADVTAGTAQMITGQDPEMQQLVGLVRAAAEAAGLEQGEALAERVRQAVRAIQVPGRLTQVLSDLIRTADNGHLERPGTLIGLATEAAQAITDPDWRAQALTGLARAVADAGDPERARALAALAAETAYAIPDPDRRSHVLGDLARTAAGIGDPD